MKLSSTNKRILVIGDIHHETMKLHNIIKHESPDNIVVLGDWFDSFVYDTLFDCEKTAKYLKKFVFQDNTITLWGNHDLHYFYTNKTLQCSGYTLNKDVCITEALDPVFNHVKDKFKWYIWIDDYLCTHAGLHPSFIPPYAKTNEDIDKFLSNEVNNSKHYINTGDTYWLYGAGSSRCGRQRYGGLVWLDFQQEFEPVDDLKQIVGHTFTRTKCVQTHITEGYMDPSEGNNLCIDTNLNEYLIIHNGKVNIKRYLDI